MCALSRLEARAARATPERSHPAVADDCDGEPAGMACASSALPRRISWWARAPPHALELLSRSPSAESTHTQHPSGNLADAGRVEMPPAALGDRCGDLTGRAVFYLDPHVCMRCRYRERRTAVAMPALPRLEYVRGGGPAGSRRRRTRRCQDRSLHRAGMSAARRASNRSIHE